METKLSSTAQYSILILFFLAAFLYQNNLKAEEFAPPINGSIFVCEGDVNVYTYSYNPANTYQWSVIGGTGTQGVDVVNNLSTYTVEWGLAGNPPYTINLTVTQNGIPIANEILNVIIGTSPEPHITSNFSSDCIGDSIKPSRGPILSCDVVCEFTDVTYTTDFNSGSQYEWTVIGNYSNVSGANTNEAVVSWTGPGQALVIVKETNLYGCEGFDTVCIEIVEKPESKFKVVQAQTVISSSNSNFAPVIEICKGSNVCFDDLSQGASAWFWDFGNGGTSTDQNPCQVFDQPGGYLTRQIVENNCGCRDTSYLWVKVLENEGPEIVCNNVVCGSGVFSYQAILPSASCSNVHYEWHISNNGFIVGHNGTANSQTSHSVSGSNITSIEIDWQSGPNGTISLSVTGCDEVCSSVTTLEIPIIPPTIDIVGDSVLCLYEKGKFEVPCYPGAKYTWIVDGVIQSSTTSELSYSFNTSGDHEVIVKYENKLLSCMGESNVFKVRVLNEFNATGDKMICEGTTATFNSMPNSLLNWEVVDANNTLVDNATSTSTFTTISTLSPGTYGVYAYDASSPRLFCNEQVTLLLEVIETPTTATTINGPIEVCVGEAAVYHAVSSSSDYYLEWEINNGGTLTTSNGNSVSVIWGSGTKSITLYQVSKGGDCKSDPYTININDKPIPSISITGDNSVCGNTNSSTPHIYQTTANLDAYEWSISPATAGSVISGQNTNSISVVWNNYTGFADVSLKPTVCSNTSQTVNFQVEVKTPTLSISGPDVVCQDAPSAWNASFDIGNGTNYSWEIKEFGGSTTVANGNGSTVNYNFPNHSGSFVVIVKANNCNGQYTASKAIVVNPKPVANLTYNGIIECIDDHSVDLILSMQNPSNYTYTWYKNGNPINPQPGTTYTIGNNAADAGNYWVEVVDVNGCVALTDTLTAKVCQGGGPSCTPNGATASFTYSVATNSPNPSCTQISFTETISQPTNNITWYYNGNVIATGSNPTYTVAASGVYPIILVANFGPNYCAVVDTQTVIVPVVSDFEINVECSSNGLNVDFLNTSDVVIHPLSTFNHQWNVYDINNTLVTSSTSLNFMNVTGLIGGEDYMISLTETKSYNYHGQSVNANCTHTIYFTMPEEVDADFSISDPIVCEGNIVEFTDQSVGNIASWEWDFGDNSSILSQNPTKTYAAVNSNFQNFNVNLVVVDEYGCTDNLTKPVEVRRNNIDGTISINPSTPICPTSFATLTFNNTTSPSSAPYSYLWSNNATTVSMMVNQTSTNYISVTDQYGCNKSFGPAAVKVEDIPTPVISGDKNHCMGGNVYLSAHYGDNYTYQWLIKYPTSTSFIPLSSSTSSVTVYNLFQTGTYEVKVVITDPVSNCTKESQVFTFTVHTPPVVPYVVSNPTPACPNNPVTLMVLNPQDYVHISWSTGDVGMTATALSAGIYVATGTDINGCKSQSFIQVHDLPDFCTFMCGCYSDCIAPGDTFFFPGVEGDYAEWRWEELVGGNWMTVQSGNGMVEDYIVTTQTSVTIRLYLKTYYGCEDYSCAADLDISICEKPCEGKAAMKRIDCFTDREGHASYKFSADVYFDPFGMPCKEFYIAIIPPFGSIDLASPNPVHPGLNTFTGIWNTNQTFIPGGEYCFDIVITNGCDKSSCVIEKFCFRVPPCGNREPNGIEDHQMKDDFIHIYPNPSNGNVTIESTLSKTHEIRVYTTQGKLVHDERVNFSVSSKHKLELHHLSRGIYFVQCITDGAMETKKIIIK